MKKRVFFQVSIILYIALTIFLAIMAASIYVIVWLFQMGLQNWGFLEWVGFFAAIGGFLFMLYTVFRMGKNRIILEHSEIFVPEHWGSKNSKIQYETHISYQEIKSISIVSSNKNSLNKNARWVFMPMPYIVFGCIDDRQKAVNVFYFSKKQVVRIINDVLERTKQLGNEIQSKSGEEILSEFLVQQKNKIN